VRVYGPPLGNHIGPNGPEFPLLSQEYSRVEVPQPPYECGNPQKDWVPKPPVLFFTRGSLGVKLHGVRDGMFEGVNDRDKPPFDAACHAITIGTHVGHYVIGPSLTTTNLASSFRGILPVPRWRRN
jgi:hypothetical protein